MKNKCIVGVFGTANTGKTTFINDLVEKTSSLEDPLERWTVFGKNYRDEITKRGLKINREGNEECQQVIHDILVGNIIDAVNCKEQGNYIMDRTIIDSFVYTYWHYKFGTVKINPDTIDRMWNQTVKYAKMFDILIYIPLKDCENIAVVDDKFRDVNYEYRKQIDCIMNSVWYSLAGIGCKMKTLYGTREERVDSFLNTIYFLHKTDSFNLSIDVFHNVVDNFKKEMII